MSGICAKPKFRCTEAAAMLGQPMINRRRLLIVLACPALAFAAKESAHEIPIGSWSHEATGLYVSVTKADNSSDSSSGIIIGDRYLVVGGPPPRKNKADDVFMPKQSKTEGGVVETNGTFNWDSDAKNVQFTIAWKDGKVLIEIVTNEGYDRFPVGKYLLKADKK